MLCIPDFLGDIPCVHIVQNVLKGGNFIAPFVGIEIVRNGDISDSLGLEEYLRIVASHDIVTAQARKILGYYQVNQASFHIFKKSSEAGPFKIKSGVAVINVKFVDAIMIRNTKVG